MSTQSSLKDLQVDTSKTKVLNIVKKFIVTSGYTIELEDKNKPWGAYFTLSEQDIEMFTSSFFSPVQNIIKKQEHAGLALTPKILVVAPGQKLSWQYHHRRKELWRVTNGPVGVITNNTDTLPHNLETYNEQDIITIQKEQRHRLVGLNNWGIISEIWIHIDPENPSNEEDIVRVKDDYNR